MGEVAELWPRSKVCARDCVLAWDSCWDWQHRATKCRSWDEAAEGGLLRLKAREDVLARASNSVKILILGKVVRKNTVRGFVVANEETSIKGNIQVDKDINLFLASISSLIPLPWQPQKPINKI